MALARQVYVNDIKNVPEGAQRAIHVNSACLGLVRNRSTDAPSLSAASLAQLGMTRRINDAIADADFRRTSNTRPSRSTATRWPTATRTQAMTTGASLWGFALTLVGDSVSDITERTLSSTFKGNGYLFTVATSIGQKTSSAENAGQWSYFHTVRCHTPHQSFRQH